MSNISKYVRDDMAAQYPEQAIIRSMRNVQEAAALARTGISEISQTHAYASDTVERTIAAAYRLVKAAEVTEELSAHKRAIIYHLTQAYLHEMLAVSDDVAASIMMCLLEHGR